MIQQTSAAFRSLFRSIRWKLTLSYVLLTLFTIAVVGFLALAGVTYYAEQQESLALTANAQTIANQAAPLLTPATPQRRALTQLARAASFFGSARVRILDAKQNPLADSGTRVEAAQFGWLVLPLKNTPSGDNNGLPDSWIVGILPNLQDLSTSDAEALTGSVPPDTWMTIIRRIDGPWGSRLVMGSKVSSPMGLLQKQDTSATHSERIVTAPVTVSGKLVGYVELRSTSNVAAEAATITQRVILLAGAIAVVLAIMVGLYMSRRLTTPLVGLTETTRRMTGGDLTVRANVHGRDETGELADSFNRMAGQLQESFAQLQADRDSLRRFIADASHELRTPITALRNFNELLLGPAEDDAEARREFLTESQAQIDKLTWITANLLDLSRLEAGLAGLDKTPEDVREIVESAAIPFRSLAAERGVDLKVTLPPERIEICCDRARAGLVFTNLLDNALKFTPDGGLIEIGLAPAANGKTGARPGGAHIWVQDSGPGIPPGDLARIFERFYRAPSNPHSGSGLGLSIVQSIVQAHGGKISAESKPGHGARFTVEWPG
jgi:signal transduction histidine kinase